MKDTVPALLLMLLFASPLFAAGAGPALPDINKLIGNANLTDMAKQAQQMQGQGAQNLTDMAKQAAGVAGLPSIALPAPPTIIVPASQLRILGVISVILFFIFAAGKIADFLQSSGKKISKREALYSPFAYIFLSGLGVLLYFSSSFWKPPQDTLITNAFYLLLIPAAIVIGVGALVLHSFFHGRLNAVQSLDLSMHIILAPVFDGLKGYWTALGAAAILVGISSFAFYSSGGRLALVTLDFLLLSIVVSLYYLYRALTSTGNENKASNVVTMLTILAPSILQGFFKELVCAVLSHIPLDFFRSCPLYQVGNEVTLALSVGATLLLMVPVVPIVYAMMVNLLRALTLAQLLLKKEPKEPFEQKDTEERGASWAYAPGSRHKIRE